MDVARLNLSHGAYADHEEVYQTVREAPATRPAARSASSSTCRVRRSALGRFSGGPVDARQRRRVHHHHARGRRRSTTEVGTTYKGLPGDVSPGDALLIDDGKVALEAVEVTDTDVTPRVDRGRHGLQQQGHQPARRRRQRPGDVREGQGGPALGAAACAPT